MLLVFSMQQVRDYSTYILADEHDSNIFSVGEVLESILNCFDGCF